MICIKLPSFLGANNDFAKACEHDIRTKSLKFCHKLKEARFSLGSVAYMGPTFTQAKALSSIPAYTASSSFSGPFYKELDHTEVLLEMKATWTHMRFCVSKIHMKQLYSYPS